MARSSDTAMRSRIGDRVLVIMAKAPRPGDVNEVVQLVGRQVSVIAQKGEGLAAGFTSVFAHFTDDRQRHTIAFNSDSPHLSRSVLDDCTRMLAAHDVVVGPTHDGGYSWSGQKHLIPRF